MRGRSTRCTRTGGPRWSCPHPASRAMTAGKFGASAAGAIALVGVLYAAVIVLWIIAAPDMSQPITDPYLAVMELLTLLSAIAIAGFATALFRAV